MQCEKNYSKLCWLLHCQASLALTYFLMTACNQQCQKLEAKTVEQGSLLLGVLHHAEAVIQEETETRDD